MLLLTVIEGVTVTQHRVLASPPVSDRLNTMVPVTPSVPAFAELEGSVILTLMLNGMEPMSVWAGLCVVASETPARTRRAEPVSADPAAPPSVTAEEAPKCAGFGELIVVV